MNKIILATIVFSSVVATLHIMKQYKKQLAEVTVGFAIPCRPANPDIPSITMDTVNGDKLICNVLKNNGIYNFGV